MTAVVLLALLVTADVARSAPRGPRTRTWLTVAAVSAAGLLLATGLGANITTVVVGVALAAAWSALMPITPAGESSTCIIPAAPPRAWPAPALAVVLATAAIIPAPTPHGPIVDAWERTVPAHAGVTVVVALAVIVVVVGLTRTANLVTRAALARARRAPEPGPHPPGTLEGSAGPRPAGWRLTVRGRDIAEVHPRAKAPTEAGPVMRGGRYIGPLERIIVLVLALAGAYGIIAAVLAAKGVVRFPEISADRARGTKAEEFLVGSFVSWACAGAGVLLVRVAGLG